MLHKEDEERDWEHKLHRAPHNEKTEGVAENKIRFLCLSACIIIAANYFACAPNVHQHPFNGHKLLWTKIFM